jgi:hypothetical protein
MHVSRHRVTGLSLSARLGHARASQHLIRGRNEWKFDASRLLRTVKRTPRKHEWA